MQTLNLLHVHTTSLPNDDITKNSINEMDFYTVNSTNYNQLYRTT
jgi:hypothetical protein